MLWAWVSGAGQRAAGLLVPTLLAALGLEAVRRQSIAELPDAVGGSFTAGVRNHLAAPARLGDRADSDVGRLERLAALRAQGALTDEEFEALKRPRLQ